MLKRLLLVVAPSVALVLVLLVLVSGSLGARQFNPEITLAINNLVTGVTPFTAIRAAAASYFNWGSTQGTSGYGLRDNAGTIQVKNSGGAWANIVTGSTLPTAASFLTRVAESTLSNETALGSLATGALINTTTTGVPTVYAGATCTNQFARALSASLAATCASVSLTADVTGLLPVANGGTGLTAGTVGGVVYFSGASTLASSGALTLNRLVLGGGTGALTSQASAGTASQLLHGGGPPTWGAVDLTAEVSGILPTANGGTGVAYFAVAGPTVARTYTFPDADATILTDQTAITPAQGGTGIVSYAVGDVIYATGATTLARLADVATGNVLLSGGVTTAPAYGKVGLTTHVTGTLPVANGGTSFASYTAGDLLYATGATTLTRLAIGASGAYARSNGVGVLWSTLLLPNAGAQGEIPVVSALNTITQLAVGTAGQFLRSAGVGATVTWSTTIFPNAATQGNVLVASAANTYSNVAVGTAGQLLRSGGAGVTPAWSTAVWPNTATTGDLVYASGADTYANLADVATGRVLISGGVGVAPSWSATPVLSGLTFTTLADSSTAPTVASGFGTTPLITANGTAAFKINVGTGGVATGGVFTMPAATTGWACSVTNLTAKAANRADSGTFQTATTTTSVTIQNQTLSTGAALAWVASDVVQLSCRGY
jgi:hypothetical protein